MSYLSMFPGFGETFSVRNKERIEKEIKENIGEIKRIKNIISSLDTMAKKLGYEKYGNGYNLDYLNHKIRKLNREIIYKKAELNFYKPKEILDDVEKEYLKALIKPFKNRVKLIKKLKDKDDCFITIYIKEYRGICKDICLPWFKEKSMYKGMDIGKEYTMEELGLWK